MIKEAEAHQAREICDLLISSITELCVLDHQNNPEILSSWLRNKTLENCTKWINQSDASLLVAMDGNKIGGVAQLGRQGDLYLCYVLPEEIHKGIGSALVGFVEKTAITWGLEEINLESTSTARRFYERNGYELVGESVVFNVMRSYHMKKNISANSTGE